MTSLLLLVISASALDRGMPRPSVEAAWRESGTPPMVALVGGTVLPMTGDGPAELPDATVLFQGDELLAVGPAVPLPRGVRVVDVHGAWVLPGLIDAHVHVFDPRELPLYLAAGVTGVVNLSGFPELLDWRAQVRTGTRLGPRMWTSGPMIDEVDDPWFGTMEAVQSPRDAQIVVGRQARAGYDAVKLHGDLEVGLYDAVVEQAHGRGLPVVGHLSERVGLLHALAQGQATVEHTEELVWGFFNGRLDRGRIPLAVEALGRSGAAVTPTLVSMDRLARMLDEGIGELQADPHLDWLAPLTRVGWAPSTNPYRRALGPREAERYRASLRFQRELTAALAHAEVPLMAGTDSGWVPFLVPGAALHDELAELRAAGLGSEAALVAATRTPGLRYGGPRGPGVLAAGHPADILVLDVDPRLEPTSPEAVRWVVARGQTWSRAQLDDARAAARAESAPEAELAAAVLRGDSVGAVDAARALGKRLRPPTAVALARRLLEAGRPDAARAVLVLGAAANPEDWSARALAGRALLADGHAAEAAAELREALRRAPAGIATELIHADLERATRAG